MAMGTRRSAPFRHTTFSAVETCVLAQRLVELIKGHKDFRKSSPPFSVKSSDHSIGKKNLLKLNICHRFRNIANKNSGIGDCSRGLDIDATYLSVAHGGGAWAPPPLLNKNRDSKKKNPPDKSGSVFLFVNLHQCISMAILANCCTSSERHSRHAVLSPSSSYSQAQRNHLVSLSSLTLPSSSTSSSSSSVMPIIQSSSRQAVHLRATGIRDPAH